MDSINQCMRSLVGLAGADDPNGVASMERAVDAFLEKEVHRQLPALMELETAFGAAAPKTDFAAETADFLAQKRRHLTVEGHDTGNG